MKKHIKQNILKFLLPIVIVSSSGCGQLTVTDPSISTLQPTKTLAVINTPTIQLLTATPIPCNPMPSSFTTDIEKVAEEWFVSPDSLMLNRNEYKPSDKMSKFCEIYVQAAINNEPWVQDPIELAMLITGYPNIDGVAPSSVAAYYGYKNPNIVSVTIVSKNLMDDSIRDVDNRIDLVNIDNVWKIQWAGFRLRCRRNNNDNWITTPCP